MKYAGQAVPGAAAPVASHAWHRYAAACVHGYTIAGGVLALAAFVAASQRRFPDAFLFLASALVIDATDGMLARRIAVTTHWPDIDGERLDALVDFLTFVVVPAFVAAVAGIVPAPRFLWASAMIAASLLRFSRRRTKVGGRFIYLPSCWNVVVFYGYYLRPAQALVGACIAMIAILMFVPGHYPHPALHPTRRWHLILATPAFALIVGVLVNVLPAQPWLLLSLAYPVFYGVQTIWITAEEAVGNTPPTSRLRRLLTVIIGNYQRPSFTR